MELGDERLIRRGCVLALAGIRTTTLYRGMQRGLFPKCVPVGFGERNPAVGWIESEVKEYIAARAAGASNDDLRALVKRQEEVRKRGGA